MAERPNDILNKQILIEHILRLLGLIEPKSPAPPARDFPRSPSRATNRLGAQLSAGNEPSGPVHRALSFHRARLTRLQSFDRGMTWAGGAVTRVVLRVQ